MVLSRTLSRSLRAREEESDDEPYSDELEVSSPSVLDTGEGGDIGSPDPGSASETPDEEGDNGTDGKQFEQKLSKVSFGALAKAQDALLKQEAPSRKRKRGSDTTNQQEDKLQALRERLKELKATRNASAAKPSRKTKTSATAHKASGNDAEEDQGEDHGLSSDSDSEQPAHARSSKHAPATQSSKRAVTRKRTVVEVKKPVVRDPRFDPLTGPRPDEAVLKKRYSFLNDCKSSEMAELRAIIKKTKNEAEKEILKRKLLSMESQQKAQAGKEKQQEIVREHRKKERELVKQGKKPFFLKKSEQKKLTLIDRYENMKGKQRDRVIERRRKKATARERKNMPAERRSA
ncbi:DUF947-domain-containing protein [Cenococcum geophilum 1.58]|uniref:DUF947-domain-containing protein n=1 Tax=Cenococcum geophilum 1.58 TaxID=794803 RepID=UPI00358F0ACC|nr:DUF947-domain-containing protein [Cenococcum geophilum 1.58]